MRKLMEQTATQKIFWDTDEHIVWGELDSTPQTLETPEYQRTSTRKSVSKMPWARRRHACSST